MHVSFPVDLFVESDGTAGCVPHLCIRLVAGCDRHEGMEELCYISRVTNAALVAPVNHVTASCGSLAMGT